MQSASVGRSRTAGRHAGRSARSRRREDDESKWDSARSSIRPAARRGVREDVGERLGFPWKLDGIRGAAAGHLRKFRNQLVDIGPRPLVHSIPAPRVPGRLTGLFATAAQQKIGLASFLSNAQLRSDPHGLIGPLTAYDDHEIYVLDDTPDLSFPILVV